LSLPFYLDDQNVYRASVLDDLVWLEHGFGTRLSPDWLAGREVTTVRQIHSDVVIQSDGRHGPVGEGDALIANRPGLVAIRTADCIPILMADTAKRAVAAVHAGWRGTVAEIAVKSVKRMQQVFETNPNDLLAVIGPGIGSCCFEVGPEVAIRFQSLLPERADLKKRTRIDLAEVNRRQLIGIGLSRARISTFEICTCCGGELWHSYRRDRKTAGRMTTAIGILAK
jgi:YfiH family protein